MDWANEDYVRVYTRDTPDLVAIGPEGRLVWYELMRKVDRAGVFEHGGDLDSVAEILRVPPSWWSLALPLIVGRKMAVLTDTAIVIPNFLDAQTAKRSDRQRQKESRERRRAALIAAQLTGENYRDAGSGGSGGPPDVTERDRDVTKRDADVTKRDRAVTECDSEVTKRDTGAAVHPEGEVVSDPALDRSDDRSLDRSLIDHDRSSSKGAETADPDVTMCHSTLRYTDRSNDRSHTLSGEGSVIDQMSDPSQFDFEAVYERYPRKLHRKRGLDAAKKAIRKREDYTAFAAAVARMAEAWSEKDLTYCPSFVRFVNDENWKPGAELPVPRTPTNGERKVNHGYAPATGTAKDYEEASKDDINF